MDNVDIQNKVIKNYKSELRAVKKEYTGQKLYERYMERIACNLWRYIQDYPKGLDEMKQAINEFVNNFPGLEVVNFLGTDSYYDTDLNKFVDIKTETFYVYVNTKEEIEKELVYKIRSDEAKCEYVLVEVKDTELYLPHDGDDISFKELADKINSIELDSID